MARKKIIFVIVEGVSDESALGVIFSRIFNKENVYIYICHGDITTRTGNNTSNIITKVCENIKGYSQQNHFKQLHFQEIIHIVDTDGAYISNDLIIENTDLADHNYLVNEIQTPSKTKITERNKQKKENLNKLSTTSNIWNLPYSIYYMSCNLDHVLYDKMNSSDKAKENDAYQFAQKYKEDLNGFLNYITKSDFAVKSTYSESWNFIKLDNNSLKRSSNLGLIFQDNNE